MTPNFTCSHGFYATRGRSIQAMSPGWTVLPVLKLSSYRLTTAYQVARSNEWILCGDRYHGSTVGAVLAAFK